MGDNGENPSDLALSLQVTGWHPLMGGWGRAKGGLGRYLVHTPSFSIPFPALWDACWTLHLEDGAVGVISFAQRCTVRHGAGRHSHPDRDAPYQCQDMSELPTSTLNPAAPQLQMRPLLGNEVTEGPQSSLEGVPSRREAPGPCVLLLLLVVRT